MTVGEQALYLAQLKGLSRHEAGKRLKYWFEKFEIMGWWNKKVEELSKGMQQKIQFLVTIIHKPELLIFDEPFSGFDPINASLMKAEILELRNNGATIIFSTHNMSSVEELCDDIALINQSKVVLAGQVRDIKRTFKTNTFRISFEPFETPLYEILPQEFNIISVEKGDDHQHAVVKIPANQTPNNLLSKLLPHTTIYAVNEVIPSMNDIFIQAVTNQTTTPSTH